MYHLVWIVWIPKYRKRLLKGEVKKRLEELFYECAEMNGWEIKELNIQIDHVHMMIWLKPSISVIRAVQFLKGGSKQSDKKRISKFKRIFVGK